MQRARDMPLNHLRAMAQRHEGRYSAKAAGFQVNGGPVIDLAVNHRIHQPHHLRRQFRHSRRGLRIVVRPIVAHPKVRRRLIQIQQQLLPVLIIIVFIIPVPIVQ